MVDLAFAKYQLQELLKSSVERKLNFYGDHDRPENGSTIYGQGETLASPIQSKRDSPGFTVRLEKHRTCARTL